MKGAAMSNTVFLRLVVIGIAMLAGAWGSYRTATGTMRENRKVEWPDNEKSEPLTSPALHWTIVHIRDDVGAIHNLIGIANTLRAGILAALIALFLL